MSWPYDNSANRYVKTFMKEFLDLSGEMHVRKGDIRIHDGSINIQGQSLQVADNKFVIDDLSINNRIYAAQLGIGSNIEVSGNILSEGVVGIGATDANIALNINKDANTHLQIKPVGANNAIMIMEGRKNPGGTTTRRDGVTQIQFKNMGGLLGSIDAYKMAQYSNRGGMIFNTYDSDANNVANATLILDSSHNVGIGTTTWNDAHKLHVEGTLNVSNGIVGELQTALQPNITSLGTLTSLTTSGTTNLHGPTSINGDGVLTLNNTASGSNEGGELILKDGTNANPQYQWFIDNYYNSSSALLRIRHNNWANSMVFDEANKRIGINKANPSQMLDICGNVLIDDGTSGEGNQGAKLMFGDAYGAAGPNKIQLQSSGYGFGVDGSTLKYLAGSSTHRWYYDAETGSNGTTAMTLENSTLGINLNSPNTSYKLDVNGTSQFRGNVDVNGITFHNDGYSASNPIYYHSLLTAIPSGWVTSNAAISGHVRLHTEGKIVTDVIDLSQHVFYTDDVGNGNNSYITTSSRILLKIMGKSWSQDHNYENMFIELLDNDGNAIDVIYREYTRVQNNNHDFYPIICDLKPYIKYGRSSFKIKIKMKGQGAEDYFDFKQFTICKDDSSPWYKNSVYKQQVLGGLSIGTDEYIGCDLNSQELIVQGNVGIGVTNPAYKLDISGSDAGQDLVLLNVANYSGDNNTAASIGFTAVNADASATNKKNARITCKRYDSGNYGLLFSTLNTESMHIRKNSNGIRVGIANAADTAPATTLDVSGNLNIGDKYSNNTAKTHSATTNYIGDFLFQNPDTTTGVLRSDIQNKMALGANGNNVLTIDGVNKRIGIMNNAPATALDVCGNLTLRNPNGGQAIMEFKRSYPNSDKTDWKLHSNNGLFSFIANTVGGGIILQLGNKQSGVTGALAVGGAIHTTGPTLQVIGDASINSHLTVGGDLKVDGNINFDGDVIRTDTLIKFTESIDVSNSGTQPALRVNQINSGNNNNNRFAVAEFLHNDAIAMSIRGDSGYGGDVSMNHRLSVAGDASFGNMYIAGNLIAPNLALDTLSIDTITMAPSNASDFSIAIGKDAGVTDQSYNSIAVGTYAGQKYQADESIAIGLNAGTHDQSSNSIAIGSKAARNQQGARSVAIGNEAGLLKQSPDCVAIGRQAGQECQTVNSVAIGAKAGKFNQLSSSIAIGYAAGQTSQQTKSVAIGYAAGETSQQTKSIAIGYNAGYTDQSANSIAIGSQAGYEDQSGNSVAIGYIAGQFRQNEDSVAIGNQAAYIDQNEKSVAIGNLAGKQYQGSSAVAMGYHAGSNNQGNNSIGIGGLAGQTKQRSNAIAIGVQAGRIHQETKTIALGYLAGNSYQKQYSIAIGHNAGVTSQDTACIAIGHNAGVTDQSDNSIAMGTEAGYTNQGLKSIAIGWMAGKTNQHNNSLAIGLRAGQYNQGREAGNYGVGSAIAVGYDAGNTNQAFRSIAMGLEAGMHNQKHTSLAIGYRAGHTNQNENSLAIGIRAGYTDQSSKCVAVGFDAGYNNQGASSVAMGYQAGYLNQHANTIILNAQDSALNSTSTDSVYIKPVRQSDKPALSGVKVINTQNSAHHLNYDISSGEVSYSRDIDISLGAINLWDSSLNIWGSQGGPAPNNSSTNTAPIYFKARNNAQQWTMASIAGYYAANNGYATKFPGGLAFNTKRADNTASTALTTAMVIDASGQVGIGTTRPDSQLTIGSSSTSSNQYIKIATAGGNISGIKYIGGSQNEWYTQHHDHNTNNRFAIGMDSNEYMSIINSGKVGIGSTNPSQMLDISGNVRIDNGQSTSNTQGGKLIFDDAYNKTGPNKILLHSSGYGFGVDTGDALKYNSKGKHQFYVNSSSIANGDLALQIHNSKDVSMNGSASILGGAYITGEISNMNSTKSPPGVYLGTLTSSTSKYAMMQMVSNNEIGGWIDWTDNNSNSNSDYEGRIRYSTADSTSNFKAGFNFYTDTTHRMNIGATGNVGIGMTNPAYKLDIKDASATNDVVLLNVANYATGVNTAASIGFIAAESTSHQAKITCKRYDSENYGLVFSTFGYESMYIRNKNSSNRRVGIGSAVVADPSATLEVDGNLNIGHEYSNNTAKTHSATTNYIGDFLFQNPDTTTGVLRSDIQHKMALGAKGTNVLTIDGDKECVGIDVTDPVDKLSIAGDIYLNGDNTLRKLIFSKKNNSSGDKGSIEYSGTKMNFYSDQYFRFFESDYTTEVFTIDGNAGNVNIPTGKLAIGKSTTPSQVLDVVGNITATGTITSSSDVNLKTNVKPLENALEKISKLQGVSYNRNDLEDKEATHIGVIAQEIEKEYPEVVSESETGKRVAYGNMIAPLIEAIKELNIKINELGNENTELKERINVLEQK